VAEVRVPPTRRSALAELFVGAARLDRTQSDPVVSARNAVGVAAPLAIGVLLGDAAFGLTASIGALQCAFADRPGPYRLRMLRLLATALAAGLTSGLAVVCSHSTAASVLLVLVIACAAGLLVTGGPSATQVGVAATAAALILGHIRQPLGAAPHVALLVLLGGVGQTTLAVAAWPLRRHRPERQALAGLYRELAVAARRAPGTNTGPPGGTTLSAVRTTLYGLGHDHGPSVEAYRVLLDEAERIRREVVVLSGQAERLASSGDEPGGAAIRTVLGCAARVLDEVAAALVAGRAADPDVLGPVRECVAAQTADLAERAPGRPGSPGGGVAGLTARAAAARSQALAGQLRAAVETVRTGATEGRSEDEPAVYGVRRLRDPVAILRANLAPDSAVLRHAARVALLVAGSDLVVRLGGADRGYWVPLTVLVVLRPDFATTFQRSSMRVLGTIVGLLLATGLVHWVPGGPWYLVLLVSLFFFGLRLAGPGNLALSAVGVAGLVVVLLVIEGIPAHTTVQLRAEDTLIGGALALLAMVVSPLWERQLLPERLGDLLTAYRNYLAAVSDPAAGADRLQRTRMAARRARTNARSSVERARGEPVRDRGSVELGETVLVHSHRFVHAMLTVDAVRAAVHRAGAITEFDAFTAAVAAVLSGCEQAVRSGHTSRRSGSLRDAADRLAAALVADPDRVGGLEIAGALVDASDRIANSLDTLVAELRRQLPSGDVRPDVAAPPAPAHGR
jgi:uncharacterized membrane protein YccC